MCVCVCVCVCVRWWCWGSGRLAMCVASRLVCEAPDITSSVWVAGDADAVCRSRERLRTSIVALASSHPPPPPPPFPLPVCLPLCVPPLTLPACSRSPLRVVHCTVPFLPHALVFKASKGLLFYATSILQHKLFLPPMNRRNPDNRLMPNRKE